MTSPLIFDELKALQQSLSAIGTFRTWLFGRAMSASEGITEVVF
jgi:hypothetical protein